MNLQRREEIKAIALELGEIFCNEEAESAILELLTHIDTLEQATAERVITDGSRGPGEVPAVVVPELTDEDLDSMCGLHEDGGSLRAMTARNQRMNFRSGYSLAISRARAIHAGRVLGEGMVAVDREELRALERVRMEAEYVKDAFQQMGEFSQMEGIMRALHELGALRANQGGVDHD
jgi:hypothetical protein